MTLLLKISYKKTASIVISIKIHKISNKWGKERTVYKL